MVVILSQNGRNDLEGQGQLPIFPIKIASIQWCMFGTNLVILDEIRDRAKLADGQTHATTITIRSERPRGKDYMQERNSANLPPPLQNFYQPYWYKADSRFGPNQWKTSLQSNVVPHWLGANLESALLMLYIGWPMGGWSHYTPSTRALC